MIVGIVSTIFIILIVILGIGIAVGMFLDR